MSHAMDRVMLGPLHNPVRGVLHGGAALLSLSVALHFLLRDAIEPTLRIAFVVFAATQMGLYLVSASYHSLPWSPRWKRRMQRADHAMIFVAIAGSVTPLALLGGGELREFVVAAVWTIAALGVAQKAFLPQIHERASIPVQIAQAALAIPALLGFSARFPGAPGQLALLAVGCYAIGALVFLTERPRLWPRVFSFHELFHVCVVAGSAALSLLAAGIVPRGP